MLRWVMRLRMEISDSRFSRSLLVSLLRMTDLIATGACVSCEAVEGRQRTRVGHLWAIRKNGQRGTLQTS